MMRRSRLVMPLAVALLVGQPQGAAGAAPTAEDAIEARVSAISQIEAAVREAIDRLGLTDDQQATLRPILVEHGEAQRAVLEKHSAALADRGGRRPEIEHLQRMNKALRRNNARFEGRIAKHLSEEQMAVFGQIQAGGRQRLREFVTARRLERIGQELGLSEEQMSEAAPILIAHGEAQMALFDKHDIEVGSREKKSYRTLLALRQETRAVNARTLRRLSAILSEEQLANYKAMQDEQQRKVRARIP